MKKKWRTFKNQKINEMILGITGTRSGMSELQRSIYITFIRHHKPEKQIDGCCVGVDSEAFEIAMKEGIFTIGKPGYSARNPKDLTLRDNEPRDEMHEPKPHFVRNRDIVNECDYLIAMPYILGARGGTNYTINYARKVGKKMLIILRGGHMISK